MAPNIPLPVIPEEEEDWGDASSSSDDTCNENNENSQDSERLSPPPGLLFPHEMARPPSPPIHAPRLRLLYHSQTWDTQVYMLKDGKVLKERASFPNLSRGYFGAVEMNQKLLHWFRVLPEQLEEILGSGHPYLSRVAIAMAPRQYMLMRGSGNSDHLPDQLVEPFPEMKGRLVMERVRPVKPAVIRVLVDKVISPALHRRANTAPENYNLHPKAWLGFEQPPAVRDMLRNHPNLSTRPAYLNELVRFIGRRGVLELAREMGTALAVIHYDLHKDAHGVKFRIGYNPVLDKAKLWVCGLGRMGDLKENERFYPRPGVGHGVFDAFWAAYVLASEGILQWRMEKAVKGSGKDAGLRSLMIKVLLERLDSL
ncbi:uncharacterized protein LY79DRAFT_590449 [Colletotrichum navitas]|uniref:Uncharacterized protein n=1 Tax=Colletotrichum navitas TaxID=681940 RepID=A0AAD8PZF7_9PEZI|nr:uncharacterized protein LY79DRAFT_590449 [Colletotrichum navitas]KAK1590497.1 hypothetical protein LY79DRAFT_590449 [Colletotrichum navitas]